MKTKQETFDFVVKAILQQGKPARSAGGQGGCMYRTKDGLKCAAGHCIPDDKYDPKFEGLGLVTEMPAESRMYPGEKERREKLHATLAEHDRGLLRDLQNAHDCSPPSEFIRQFRLQATVVAHDHGLSTAVLDEVTP